MYWSADESYLAKKFSIRCCLWTLPLPSLESCIVVAVMGLTCKLFSVNSEESSEKE